MWVPFVYNRDIFVTVTKIAEHTEDHAGDRLKEKCLVRLINA